MTKRLGERQVKRSRDAIKAAFGQLLGTKSYSAITVGKITEIADVGRSTFYRHFNGKADVLIALHADMFHALFTHSADKRQWYAETPSQQMVDFLSNHMTSNGQSVSLSADIGSDVDYIMRHVNELLVSCIEEGLRTAFGQDDSIELSVLARSIAGIFLMCLMSQSRTMTEAPKEQLADVIQKKIRALVVGTFGEEHPEPTG